MKVPAVLTRLAAALRPKAFSAVPGMGGWFGVIRESFSGAFQANIEVDAPKNLLAFSAVWACVTLIAGDISTLDLCIEQEGDDGICKPAKPNSPFWAVVRKPNHYQNRIQFIEQWIISKLLFGNTYALKIRDNRNMVVKLYILDAQRVTPLVADSGDVFYQVSSDHLAGLQKAVTFPASEIIHDRMNTLWHPLVGISPLYAGGMSATMGSRIQANSATFFNNMSRPSGMLTAPTTINDETANRLKGEFEQNFGGSKIGKVFVGGDGLSYSAMSMNAVDSQLNEQFKMAVEDVARCFHVPLFKIGAEAGKMAGTLSVEAQQQLYLNDVLRKLIEALEECLTNGLELPGGTSVDVDETGLLRMDTAARYDALGKAVNGGWMAPNEARASEDLPPVAGGESPYLQMQNFSLAALAKRDALADPFGTKPAPSPAADAAQQADEAISNAMKASLETITKGLENV